MTDHNAGDYADVLPDEEQARDVVLANRAETLRRAEEYVRHTDWSQGGNLALLVRRPGIPELTQSTVVEPRVLVRVLCEAYIPVDTIYTDGAPSIIHAGFGLDSQGRILQFTNGGGEKRVSGGRIIEVVLCEPLGSDPATDQVAVADGKVQLSQPFAGYQVYDQAGLEAQLRASLSIFSASDE